MADTNWDTSLTGARKHLKLLTEHLQVLNDLRDKATAQVLQLGQGMGVELDAGAVQALIDKPYILVPLDKNNWRCITWRGRKDMPVIGWVESQTAAYIVSVVQRSMRWVSDIPDWMIDQLGWDKPEFQTVIPPGKNEVQVLGDRAKFKRQYGSYLGGATEKGFEIKKGRAWIQLLEKMLNDGLMPGTGQHVASEDWDKHAPCPIGLRDYQKPYVEQFLVDGAETIVLPSGGGKTYIGLYLLAHFKGRQYIFCDSDVLVQQWRARLAEYLPHIAPNVQVMTYQSAVKRIDTLHGTFVLCDEGHRLPAETWSRLAFIDVKYHALATATPWRLDRQAMVYALGGPPRAVPWRTLMEQGVLDRPKVRVVQVPTVASKLQWIRRALDEHANARTLIYCDSIQYGKELAAALDLPFIYGETRDKYKRVTEERQAIVSKALEASIDIPDLQLVIEVDVSRTGRGQISEGQRIGRVMHRSADAAGVGEYYILLTPDELHRFGSRLLGVESQLGDVIEYVDLTGQGGMKALETAPKARSETRKTRKATRAVNPGDEIGAALVNPAVRKLIEEAEAKIGVKASGYVEKAIRTCWESPVTFEELQAGTGVGEEGMKRWRAGIRAAQKIGLVADVGNGRYMTDRSKINNLIKLSQRFKK